MQRRRGRKEEEEEEEDVQTYCMCSEAGYRHPLLTCWVDQSQLGMRCHVNMLTGGRGYLAPIQVFREREYFIRDGEYSIRERKYFVREGYFVMFDAKESLMFNAVSQQIQNSCTVCSI